MMYCQLIVLVLGLAVAVLAKAQVARISSKIVGGISIDISGVPYIVSLNLGVWHTCGGSIIHPSWILTAAHCVRDGTVTDYSIRAGSKIYFYGGVVVQVSQIIKHPFYEENGTNNYDAALLKLEFPLEINDKIMPIPFTGTEPKDGDLLLISGWGFTEEIGTFSSILQATVVPIFSKDKCKQIYRSIRRISESMFCAGFPDGGKDACTGDSGGPAVFNGKLVGIVSYGKGCGQRNSPGVYINVTMIKPWIESLVR